MILFKQAITLDENGGFVLYVTTNGESVGDAVFTQLPKVTIFRPVPTESVSWTFSGDFKTFTIADNTDNASKLIEVVCEG